MAGLVLGLLVAADLILASVIRFDSAVVTWLPPVGALIGFALGWLAPLQRRRRPTEAPALDMVVETDEPTVTVTSDLRQQDSG